MFTPEQEQKIVALERGLHILVAALAEIRREHSDNVRFAVAERSQLVREYMQEVEGFLLAGREEEKPWLPIQPNEEF